MQTNIQPQAHINTMKTTTPRKQVMRITALLAAFAVAQATSQARIDGTSGSPGPGGSKAFSLTAKSGYISTADGNNVFFWGFADGAGAAQYPGPTMIVNQGDQVQVSVSSALSVPTSLVFPGQSNVVESGGTAGVLAREAAANGGSTVTYTFRAWQPGTYLYHSGTRADLQVEMGLIGALIIRPTNSSGVVITNQAYNHADSTFDEETLFLLSEMDPVIHEQVELGKIAEVDTSKWFPTYWFINGRTGPDTLSPAGASWLPSQPYDCTPTIPAGKKILMRLIGAGRDPHPFHHHGNNSWTIARDGRLLRSSPSQGADLASSDFTINVYPGGTVDALWNWTGYKLGWDAYGHAPGDPMVPGEYAPDHGKPFPVTLPSDMDLTYGMFYGGSPFLGGTGALPPGEGGFNTVGGYMFMWHSHSEKELCNYNIFPGGMLTMMIVTKPQ